MMSLQRRLVALLVGAMACAIASESDTTGLLRGTEVWSSGSTSSSSNWDEGELDVDRWLQSTSSTDLSDRAMKLKVYFSEQGISSRSSLETPGTPQNSALRWLADRDPRQLDIPYTSVASPEGYPVLQRYLLAVSYFQMGGGRWSSRSGFLSGNSTCNWNADVVNDTAAVPSRVRGQQGRKRKVGASCNGQGKITSITLSGNNAYGCVPPELECLTSLTTVDLTGNPQVNCSRAPLSDSLHGKVTTDADVETSSTNSGN